MENSGSTLEPENSHEFLPRSRPGSVTILVLGVLIITILNLLRLILSIQYWDFLVAWPGVSPAYMVLTGLIWTLSGGLLFWGLWKAKNWAPRLMKAVALTYALYYWLDHVFLVDHPASGVAGAQRALLPVNWPFAAAMTAVCLVYIAWTLNHSKVKAYFGQAETKLNLDQSSMDGDL